MKGLNKIIVINTLVFIPLFISSYSILNNNYQKSLASKIGWKRWWKTELIKEENELGYRGRKFINNGKKKDIILLAHGGHGFKVVKDVEMIEVKQGPYSVSKDKIKFENVDERKIKYKKN